MIMYTPSPSITTGILIVELEDTNVQLLTFEPIFSVSLMIQSNKTKGAKNKETEPQTYNLSGGGRVLIESAHTRTYSPSPRCVLIQSKYF